MLKIFSHRSACSSYTVCSSPALRRRDIGVVRTNSCDSRGYMMPYTNYVCRCSIKFLKYLINFTEYKYVYMSGNIICLSIKIQNKMYLQIFSTI